MNDAKEFPLIDSDPQETKEWKEALDSVMAFEGTERAQFFIKNVNGIC